MPTPSRRRSARRRPIRSRCRRRKRASRRAPKPTIWSASMPRCRAAAKADVLGEFGGGQFSNFKNALVELCVAKLSPIASEMKRLVADPGHVDRDPGRRRRPRPRHRRRDHEGDEGHRRFRPQALDGSAGLRPPMEWTQRWHCRRFKTQRTAACRAMAAPWQHAACLAQHRDMHDHPATKLRDGSQAEMSGHR